MCTFISVCCVCAYEKFGFVGKYLDNKAAFKELKLFYFDNWYF